LLHSFFGKTEAPPLQAADMLAWQTSHYFERKNKGHDEPRADFKALIRPWDYMNFYQRTDLEQIKPLLEAAKSVPLANQLII
jgi:hypothetical protein